MLVFGEVCPHGFFHETWWMKICANNVASNFGGICHWNAFGLENISWDEYNLFDGSKADVKSFNDTNQNSNVQPVLNKKKNGERTWKNHFPNVKCWFNIQLKHPIITTIN